MSLILRGEKGQKLTLTELDNNFQYLESLIGTGGGGTTASFLYEGPVVFELLDEDKLFNEMTDYELPLTSTQSLNFKGIFLTQSIDLVQEIEGATVSFRIDNYLYNGYLEFNLNQVQIDVYLPIEYSKIDYHLLEPFDSIQPGLISKSMKYTNNLITNQEKIKYGFTKFSNANRHFLQTEIEDSEGESPTNLNPIYERFRISNVGDLQEEGFYGFNLNKNPYIEFGNLPTSSSGLQSGQLWVDTANDNVIKVFYPS
jgi:hypothetical protein